MMRYLDSLNRALYELCTSDPRVYILGQDILDPYGGAFKVTRGLSSQFPHRVLATPICEYTMIGIAIGMAMRGLRPIVEIMFGDFLLLGADQIANHAAKYRVMYANKVEVPLVIRTPMGGGRGYGPTHSQSLEKLFLGIPHLKVIAPSRFHDPGALLKAAVLDPDPVLFIEHKLLYPTQVVTSQTLSAPLSLDWCGDRQYPIALLRNYSTGKPDVTVLTYAGGSKELDAALLKLINEEIRVQCLLPALLNHLDIPLIASLVADSPLVVWEEGTGGFDWGAEVIASLYNELGAKMGPVRRLASWPTVVPAAKHLERAVIPGTERLEQAVFAVLGEAFQI